MNFSIGPRSFSVEKSKSIRLKDMVLKYENDEIVEYSTIRAFKNKILNEFCGNTKKITKVEVQQDDKDIICKISTHSQKFKSISFYLDNETTLRDNETTLRVVYGGLGG